MILDIKPVIKSMWDSGFTSEWIAKSTGMTGQTVRAVANGTNQPSLPTMRKLLALKKAIDDLNKQVSLIKKMK